ncbi:MAG: O-antigen ligase family protein [Lachnospiraceae bacterium]
MKIKGSDLNIVLLCLTFYEITVVPHYVFLGFKYLVLFWTLYQYHKEWRKNKILLTIIALYGLMTCFSSVINGMSFNTVFASLMFGIQIVDIFLICIYYIHHKSLGKLVRVIMLTFFLLLLVNDILMLFVKYNFSNPNEEYLLGNKFVVSYLHCFVTMLAFVKAKTKENNKKFLSFRKGMLKANKTVDYLYAIVFYVYSLMICAKVTCSTGIITCATMLLVIILPSKIKSFISDGKTMLIATSVINILVLGTYSLLSMPFFENIIYNVLGKSYTWKGRLIIWERIFGLIRERPILGYGYYNNAVDQLVGFGNPQNGVLKQLIDTGIIGLVFYGLIVLQSFQHPKKSELIELYPISAFFYAMIIASLVEINLTHMIVFMAMALFYATSSKKEGGV